MTNWLSKFRNDESGAVTVDFVVLVGAICTLGLAVVLIISGDVQGLTNKITSFLGNVQIIFAEGQQ